MYNRFTKCKKNTDTAQEKGYDGGKKISGIKRHIAVDSQGLPHAIYITTCSESDRDGALSMLCRHKSSLSNVEKIIADGGYTGDKFANQVTEILPSAKVEVIKRNEVGKFKVLPKRWVIERSFSWLEKCRRLWKNCERHIKTSLQMVVIVFLRICLLRS